MGVDQSSYQGLRKVNCTATTAVQCREFSSFESNLLEISVHVRFVNASGLEATLSAFNLETQS